MTQSTLLASGTAAADSSASSTTVAAGAIVTVSIFSAEPGASLAGRGIEVLQVTPGAPNLLASLDEAKRTTQINGPCTFYVDRPEMLTAFGVALDA